MSGPAILYIGGYGRSGSTILDMMLSAHPAIASGGEIFRLPELFACAEARCSCGRALRACPVWGRVRPVVDRAARELGGYPALQARFRTFEGWAGRADPAAAPHWARVNRAAFDALIGAKPGARWVVDSSKTARCAARRPARLARLLDADLRLLSLRRRPADVMRSAAKGSNRALEAGRCSGGTGAALQAYAGWIAANASARSHARALGERARDLTYETFMEDPERTLAAIADWLALPPCADWEKRALGAPRHLIGGNRTRFSPAAIRRQRAASGHDVLGTAGRWAGGVLAWFGLIP